MSFYFSSSSYASLSSRFNQKGRQTYQPMPHQSGVNAHYGIGRKGQQTLFGRADANAKDIDFLNPETKYKKLQESIDNYKKTDPDVLEKLASRFKADNHPALYKPEVVEEQKFHRRTPDLNEIPFFFAEEGTEMAKADDIKKLPPGEKEAASIRLIAKRFIDAKTGKSIFTNSSLGKASPTLQMQELPIREIRSEAATATIDRYSGKYIYNLYQHIFNLNKDLIETLKTTDKDKLPLTVHVIRPGRDKYARDCSTNFLTVATHTEVTDSLNFLAKLYGKSDLIHFSDRKQLTGIGRSSRTIAGPIGRMVLQGYYNTSEIKKGDQVVIVDDHCQAGGTILGMSAAVKEAGGKVIAAVSPTAHPLGIHAKGPYTADFSMSPKVKQLLDKTLEQWDPEGQVQEKLNKYGIPVSTLTNHEAMIIIAYATDPSDGLAMRKFEDLEASLHQGGKHVLEGESDSLKPILNQKPLSAKEVAMKMEMEVSTMRKTTKPMRTKEVHVFDYDDCLTNEQGVIYQLMHNAIQVAAQKYGTHSNADKKYPFLDHLAETMKHKMGQYQDGMPLLCMDQEQYAHTIIQSNMQKNKVSKKATTVNDLLNKLNALDPKLQAEFEALKSKYPPLPISKQEKPDSQSAESRRGGPEERKPLNEQQTAVSNILWHEFKRQYQQMIQPDSALKAQQNQNNSRLPFPDVAPTFMPGAQDLLEKLRRPENLVILLSNKSDSALQKEINKQGWAHYFDVISGRPTQLIKENGQYVNDKKLSKPYHHRLEQLTDEHHNLDEASWTFWGDTVKDGTQVLPLISKGKVPAEKVRWMLINPGSELREQANQKIAEKPDLFGKIKIIAADTLKNLSLSSLSFVSS